MRRLLMGAVTAGILAITGAGPATAAPTYGPSVGYQINAQHTGVAYGSPLPETLKRRWVSPDLGYMDSQPVIAANRVFVLASPNYRGPGMTVIADDLRTGKQLWKRTLHYDDTRTTDLNDEGLAYGDGRVYVVASDGVVRALNAATGSVVWVRDLQPLEKYSGYWHDPLVAPAGVVYAYDGGSSADLFALDWDTGAVKWKKHVPGAAPSVRTDGPSPGIWVPGYSLVTRLKLSGQKIWSRTGPTNPSYGTVAPLDGTRLWDQSFYFEPPWIINAIDGQDGPFRFASQSVPVVDGDTAILMPEDLSDPQRPLLLRGVDSSTNKTRWTFTPDWERTGYLYGPPIATTTTVYTRSETGHVLGVDVRTGRQVWSGNAPFDPDYRGDNSPAAMAIGSGYLAVPFQNRLSVFS